MAGHLQEGDGGRLLLQHVGVCVSPAQSQDQGPALAVEGVLHLLLLGAGRRGRMVGAHGVKEK